MIVVVGSIFWRAATPQGPAGRACAVALAAGARGARVEVAGKVGEDPEGDALLFALSKAGVGHVAVIRDPARRTPIAAPRAPEDDDVSPLARVRAAPSVPGLRLDAADVTLAMRYLDPAGVLVVTDDVTPDALAAAIEGGEYAGMRLVLLVDETRTPTAALPADATILAVPEAGDDDGAGAFEALVGSFAAALDAGATPKEAFAAASVGAAWEPVAEEA
jgi:sugar/nucleoside kinase (ribokinase family)